MSESGGEDKEVPARDAAGPAGPSGRAPGFSENKGGRAKWQRGAPGWRAEPSAILVRTPNWLGDLLMSTAFLRALLARFPAARVDLIVRAGFETLPLPHRGAIFSYDRSRVGPGAFGRGFKGKGYSHCFVLPPSLSSAWMAWRSGIPHRIGFAGEGRRLLLHPAMPRRHLPRSRHLVTEYLELLAPWGGAGAIQSGHRQAQPPAPGLEMSEEWIASHLPPALAGAPPYVVLAPGAEFGPAKQWPLPSYRALAEALAGAGWPVVVTGLPQDRGAGDAVVAGLGGARNLCGETGLTELVALLARAALLVSNDSGAMHVGAVLGMPQIALFGSSNPVWTAPLNPRARLFHRGLDCSPCYARECPLGHTNCLRGIGAAEVAEAALAMAGRT